MKRELEELNIFLLSSREQNLIKKCQKKMDYNRISDNIYLSGLVTGLVAAYYVDDYKLKDLSKLIVEDFETTKENFCENTNPFAALLSIFSQDDA